MLKGSKNDQRRHIGQRMQREQESGESGERKSIGTDWGVGEGCVRWWWWKYRCRE